MKRILFLIALICMSSCVAQKPKKDRAGKDSEDEKFPVAYAFPKEYAGTYAGNLNISNAEKQLQNIPMELIIRPTEDPKVYDYVLVYFVGKKREERQYTLNVIDPAKGMYEIDENNGIVLQANYIRQTLYSSFEVNNRLLNSSVQFNNDGKVIFKIIVFEKEGATETGTKKMPVMSYRTSVIQKGALRKVERD